MMRVGRGLRGPNIDKKGIRLLDAAPSHEILRKNYFIVKHF